MECTECQGGNLEAVVAQLQKKQQKKWSEQIKEIMKRIERAKPKDRFDYAIEFTKIFHSLCFSISGWGQWLGFVIQIKGSPQLASYSGFDRLTLAECEAIYPQLKALSLGLLEIDYEMSLTKEKEIEKVTKEDKKPKKKTGKSKRKKKTTYIS